MSAVRKELGAQTPIGGDLGLRVIRYDGTVEDVPTRVGPVERQPWSGIPLRDYMKDLMPRRGLDEVVNLYRTKNLKNIRRGLRKVSWAKLHGIPTFYGALWLKVVRGDEEVDLGLVSLQLVTSAGVNYLAADMAGGANDINLFQFHGFGTGTNAEATGDTALQTELTTQYAVNSVRPTGSQGAASNVYTTVATLSPDASVAITEHGIFTQAAVAGGTLWDRSVFSAVNLVGSADSLQATYAATFAAGG